MFIFKFINKFRAFWNGASPLACVHSGGRKFKGTDILCGDCGEVIGTGPDVKKLKKRKKK